MDARPRFNVPHPWGFCFAGNPEAFCCALDDAIATHQGLFRYVEIGIAYGACLRAVDNYLTQAQVDYLLQGVDIKTCDPMGAKPNCYPHPKRVEIHLEGAGAFLRKMESSNVLADFVFIDGCHGDACVTADFLGAEKIVRPGGIVAFHDTDPGCQDIHWQPHCKSGIRARAAVEKLGLLNDTRKGWFKVGETTGNKEQAGHGCLFVKRV